MSQLFSLKDTRDIGELIEIIHGNVKEMTGK